MRKRLSITLGICSCAGFISALPFGVSQEMPWLPEVSAVFFGSVALSAILCSLCQIKAATKSDPE